MSRIANRDAASCVRADFPSPTHTHTHGSLHFRVPLYLAWLWIDTIIIWFFFCVAFSLFALGHQSQMNIIIIIISKVQFEWDYCVAHDTTHGRSYPGSSKCSIAFDGREYDLWCRGCVWAGDILAAECTQFVWGSWPGSRVSAWWVYLFNFCIQKRFIIFVAARR